MLWNCNISPYVKGYLFTKQQNQGLVQIESFLEFADDNLVMAQIMEFSPRRENIFGKKK